MKKKKGFTIAELVTGMVVAAVVAISAVHIMSLNSAIIKRSAKRSDLNTSSQYVLSHIASSMANAAFVTVEDKNNITIYSHSLEKIRKYKFNNLALEYQEDSEDPVVLMRDIQAEELFKGVTKTHFQSIREFRGIKVSFHGKLVTGKTLKNTDVFNVSRYIRCCESTQLVYFDSKYKASSNTGTRSNPLNGKQLAAKEFDILKRDYSKAIFREGDYLVGGQESSICHCIYLCPGVTVTGNWYFKAAYDFHAIGESDKKVVCTGVSVRSGKYDQNIKYAMMPKSLIILNSNIEKGIFCTQNSFIDNNTFGKIEISSGKGVTTVSKNSFGYPFAGFGGLKISGIVGSSEARLFNNTITNGGISMSAGYDAIISIYDNDIRHCFSGIVLESGRNSMWGTRTKGVTRIFNNNININASVPTVSALAALYVKHDTYTEISNNTIECHGSGISAVSVDGKGYQGGNDDYFSLDVYLLNNKIYAEDATSILSVQSAKINVKNNIFYGSTKNGQYAGGSISSKNIGANINNNVFYSTNLLFIGEYVPILIDNCTFVGGRIETYFNKPEVIKNSIFWGGIIIGSRTNKMITYSDIEDYDPTKSPNPYPGVGNFREDPSFIAGDETFVSQCTTLGEKGVKVGAYGGEGAAGWANGVGCQGAVGNVNASQ